jgi:Fe-S cluster assembly scaffold protein SufB
VVELSAGARARIKYSTVQNWYAGDEEGKGGIYNFVTKRGLCHGANAFISWTQVRLLGTRCLLVPRRRCSAVVLSPLCPPTKQ